MAGCVAKTIYVPPTQPITRKTPELKNETKIETWEMSHNKTQRKQGVETQEKVTKKPFDIIEKPSPRRLASLHLTEQGRIFLESNQPDQAIRILERAVSIDPNNGENYFYIAEAWLLKRNMGQAREFNRLADIYLPDDNHWKIRILKQRNRIK